LRQQVSWVLAVLLGKLVLVPALGFLIFSYLSREQQQAHDPLLGDETSGASGAWDLALWPDDRLLRTVVVLQWAAPSCLSLITLCYRFNLGESITKAVAALYLVMYVLTTVTTTCWVSAGLRLF